MADRMLYHYSDKKGYNSLKAQVDWVFKAAQPPGKHPKGAYFTTYSPERNLTKLRIPKDKREFVFCFLDTGDLSPLPGDRGEYILYSRDDYVVNNDRQKYHGPTDELPEELR